MQEIDYTFDVQNHGTQHFNWDANGNLTYQHHKLNGERKLCWDEENRLMAVGDDNYTSYYIYDNSGERTYKLTGLNTLMNINGRWVNFATMDNPTLYTSAYLVAGLQGYTKHYYAGSERISSAIGLGGLENINDPLPVEFGGSWDEKSGSLMEEMNRTIVECLKNDYNIATSLHFLHGMTSPTAGTMDRYFYHPDHLGSSSWITDVSGNAIQHLHYLPFGEDWVDQRNASWSAPYTFSAKEKDVETGYSYFGARYYDSGLSIWLSVDPMSDKYPSMSPYNYCANNPLKYIDPNGEENLPALLWARNNMSNKGIPFRRWFGEASGWNYKKGTVPTQAVCYEACFIAYMNSTDKAVSHLKKTGFATESGGFRGRLTDKGGINWFKNGDGTDRSFVTDISKGELGDIVFMGDNKPNYGHAVLLNALPILGSYTDDNGNNVETMTLNVLSTGSYTGDNHDHFGEKTYVFEKQKDGSWKQAAGENDYVFRGYGQINKDFFESE